MAAVDRYKEDIERLARQGVLLTGALQHEVDPTALVKAGASEETLKTLPNVKTDYQAWYSEALAVITQLLPERVDDFAAYYRPSRERREIDNHNYTMSDYLKGVQTRRGPMLIVAPSSALPAMQQQSAMVSGLKKRFESTLFDIQTLLHADLLDDELEAAGELRDKGYLRASGAVAGVALEGHLGAVCQRHSAYPSKKHPAISDFNDALKAAKVIEVGTWRFVQHLADIRNKCDHKKAVEPTQEEIAELIEGVRKITKTVL